MLKTKRFNIALVALVIFSLVAMYGVIPMANAATLDSAKDTLSDSDLAANNVTHTIVFNAGPDLTTGTVITVAFNAGFTNISDANLVCPSDATEGGGLTQNMTCTVAATLASTTNQTITLTGVTNPGTAGYYDVTISHNQSGAAEETEMMVYIIDDVTVTAHVDATLTFAIGTTSPTDTINTENPTGTSSPTQLQFGTIVSGQRYLLGHTLRVTTNASDGFIVTVQQDGNMQTAAAADIDSFSTSTKAAWAAPTPNVNDDATWGWLGVTSDDDGPAFGADEYQGLDDIAPMMVFSHNGPADGSAEDAGLTRVGYSLAITALQEAGDYQNILTYICTPTY